MGLFYFVITLTPAWASENIFEIDSLCGLLLLPSIEITQQTTGDPELANILNRMNDDSALPMQIRGILYDAIHRLGARIIPFSSASRATNNVPDNCSGYACATVTLAEYSRSGRPSAVEYLGYPLLDKEHTPIDRDYRVFIQVDGGTSITPIAINIIHELAHVRFFGVMDRALRRINKRNHSPENPGSMTFFSSRQNTSYINRHLDRYLTERYAYEMAYEFYLFGKGKYFDPGTNEFSRMGITAGMPKDEAHLRIADWVTENYGFQDSRINFWAYNKTPVSQILLNLERYWSDE